MKYSNEELMELIKDGQLFNFCVGFALNKGFENAMTEGKEVRFTIGDYEVFLGRNSICFTLTHKLYLSSIIRTYSNGETFFTGNDEYELINDLLNEFKKELS